MLALCAASTSTWFVAALFPVKRQQLQRMHETAHTLTRAPSAQHQTPGLTCRWIAHIQPWCSIACWSACCWGLQTLQAGPCKHFGLKHLLSVWAQCRQPLLMMSSFSLAYTCARLWEHVACCPANTPPPPAVVNCICDCHMFVTSHGFCCWFCCCRQPGKRARLQFSCWKPLPSSRPRQHLQTRREHSGLL